MTDGTTAPSGAPNGGGLPAALVPVIGAGGAGGEKPKPDEPKTTAIETISMPKDAFEERLAKASAAATRKLLKDLGYDKPEELQAVLSAHKKMQDEQLSELDRHKKRVKELEPYEGEAKEYAGIVASMVDEQFKALPEAVQQAIDEVADGKPRERLRLMKVMKAAGLGASAPAAGTPPAAAPKTLAPAGGPPPKQEPPSSKFQEYEAIRAKNPAQASIFYRQNRAAIEGSRPADGG